jgi:hypothetical protein
MIEWRQCGIEPAWQKMWHLCAHSSSGFRAAGSTHLFCPVIPLWPRCSRAEDSGRAPPILLSRSTSLLLGLLAQPSQAGSWCGVIGMPRLGAEAAEALGVDLSRLVLIPEPGPRWLAVTATIAEVLPVVAVRPAGRAPDGEISRLAARLRDRGAVLLVQGPWPQAEAVLELGAPEWTGVGRGQWVSHRAHRDDHGVEPTLASPPAIPCAAARCDRSDRRGGRSGADARRGSRARRRTLECRAWTRSRRGRWADMVVDSPVRSLVLWFPDWPVTALLHEKRAAKRPASKIPPAVEARPGAGPASSPDAGPEPDADPDPAPARPIAVVEHNLVTACSVAARAEGVRRGQRRRDAQARCPGLVVVPRRRCARPPRVRPDRRGRSKNVPPGCSWCGLACALCAFAVLPATTAAKRPPRTCSSTCCERSG